MLLGIADQQKPYFQSGLLKLKLNSLNWKSGALENLFQISPIKKIGNKFHLSRLIL